MSESEANIHPLAIVEKGATIGKHVTIEPFAIVKANVILEDYVTIKSHAYIDGFTRIKSHTTIWPSASIGTRTQDLKYRGEKSYVIIGEHCHIREFATINSSTHEGSVVEVGNHCLIMAYCHIAHDCKVGNHVIMSNNSLLAGHVTVEDYAIIGGMTPIHQYVKVGAHAMVGGMSRVTNDVPPYTVGGGIPYVLGGINRIGLKRRSFPFVVRNALARAYRIVYRMGLHVEDACEEISRTVEPFPEVQHFIHFCRHSKRGLIGLRTGERRSLVARQEQNEDLLVEIGSS